MTAGTGTSEVARVISLLTVSLLPMQPMERGVNSPDR